MNKLINGRWEMGDIDNVSPIPVISVAVISTTYWLQRLIASVDYPIRNFAIFDNSANDNIKKELEHIISISHPYIQKFSLTSFPHNIGLPAVWNLTIKCFINEPYWLFVNDDVMFTPGLLTKMNEYALDYTNGIIHGSGGDFNDGAWDLYIIKDWVIQKYGLFDENLYPAYGEDVDYIMRIQGEDVKRITSVNIPYYHGLSTNYNETGQQTKKIIPELEEKLNNCNLLNFEYLYEKWGPDWRMTNPYKFPFNNESYLKSHTTFDLNFCRKKYIGI